MGDGSSPILGDMNNATHFVLLANGTRIHVRPVYPNDTMFMISAAGQLYQVLPTGLVLTCDVNDCREVVEGATLRPLKTVTMSLAVDSEVARYVATVATPDEMPRSGWGYTPATALDHALTGRQSMNAPWDRSWPIPARGASCTFTTDRI